MDWGAWLLLARSRAEDAVKAKVSSVRKRLVRLEQELAGALSELDGTLSAISDFLRNAEALTKLPHVLARELIEHARALGEGATEAHELRTRLMALLAKWPTWKEEVEDLLDRALLMAKSGEVDAAFELAIGASNRFSGLREKVEPILRAIRDLVMRLKGELATSRDVADRLERDVTLLSGAELTLEGEELRLVVPCRVHGIGKARLAITSRRLLLLDCLGRVLMDVPKGSVRVSRVGKAFLGFGKKLVLSVQGPEGREELVVSCSKKDLKAVLAGLGGGEARGARAAGRQP